MATVLDKLFRESKEIKKLIIQRSEQFNIPLQYVCEKVGIDYKNFLGSYINSVNNKDTNISEEDFLQLLKVLGIVLRHSAIIDLSVNMDQRRSELEEWYNMKINKING